MNAFILWNGVQVSEVAPNEPIQLNAQDVAGAFTHALQFEVDKDDLGLNTVVLQQYVSVNIARNAWLDWVSPNIPGKYVFYPDSADHTLAVYFTVSSTAIKPSTPEPQPNSISSIFGDIKVIAIVAAIILIVVLIMKFKKGF